MAERKMSERLAPLLKRYNGDTALFGTQVTKAWWIVKEVLNGRKKSEPSFPR